MTKHFKGNHLKPPKKVYLCQSFKKRWINLKNICKKLYKEIITAFPLLINKNHRTNVFFVYFS